MRIPTIPPRHIRVTGDHTPARSLLRYVWRMSGRHQIAVCLLGLGVAALSMAPLELQRRIVNQAIGEMDIPLLAVLGGTYLGVVLSQGALKYLLRVYQGWLGESAVRYCRAHLVELRSRRTAGTDGGDAGDGQAVSVIGPELDRLGGFVGEGLSQPVVNIGMSTAILGYMLVIDTQVAVISLCFLLPQIVLVPMVQRAINRLIEERVALMRRLGDAVAEIGPEIGAEAARKASAEEINPRIEEIYANRIRVFLLKFALKGAINLLNALAPLSVLIVGGYLVIQGETTLGIVVAFITGFERLAAPLRELLAYYRVATQAAVQHRMIARWM
jgi:ABC-type multidrug transport system fused ATPase/permease subunit